MDRGRTQPRTRTPTPRLRQMPQPVHRGTIRLSQQPGGSVMFDEDGEWESDPNYYQEAE